MLNQLQHKRFMLVEARAQAWYTKLLTSGCDKHETVCGSIMPIASGNDNKQERPDYIHT